MSLYGNHKKECQACVLRKGCYAPVLGAGPHESPVILVNSYPDPESHAVEVSCGGFGEQQKRLKWLCDTIGIQTSQVRHTYAVACLPDHSLGIPIVPWEATAACPSYWLDKELTYCREVYRKEEPTSEGPLLIAVGSIAMGAVIPTIEGTAASEHHGCFLPSRVIGGESFPMVCPLMGWETLRERVRTKIIEKEWLRAIERLRWVVRLMDLVPDEPIEPPHPWPVCGEGRRRWFPCKCDELIDQLRARPDFGTALKELDKIEEVFR